MPLLTLHLLRLQPTFPVPDFLSRLQSSPGVSIVLASAPQHIVVWPQRLDRAALTSADWDVLLLLSTPTSCIPSAFSPAIRDEYKVCCGVSSKLLATYPQRSRELRSQVPQVTGSLERALRDKDTKGGERLELSEDLIRFMGEMERRHGERRPVTMLNLLQFHWPDGKGSYFEYGQAFKTVAASRGGDAKIVGNVVPPPPQGGSDSRGERGSQEEWWNEVSLVHYPSIRSFCDMLAGDDYQEINARHRLAALRDTFLLCTTETLLDPPPAEAKL